MKPVQYCKCVNTYNISNILVMNTPIKLNITVCNTQLKRMDLQPCKCCQELYSPTDNPYNCNKCRSAGNHCKVYGCGVLLPYYTESPICDSCTDPRIAYYKTCQMLDLISDMERQWDLEGLAAPTITNKRSRSESPCQPQSIKRLRNSN